MDPSTGIRLIVDAHRADEGGPAPITLDMEFATEGGEGPTPYEVLLHAALVGDSKRFTRQDAVEEAWRDNAATPRRPAARAPVRPRLMGAGEADRLVAGFGRWHGPWIES